MTFRNISISAFIIVAASFNSLAASKTINIATAAFKKYGKSVSSLAIECLSFSEEGSSDVNVREKHGGKCGGDPATSPSVAHIRIKGKKVLILDPIGGEYKSFNSKYKLEY